MVILAEHELAWLKIEYDCNVVDLATNVDPFSSAIARTYNLTTLKSPASVVHLDFGKYAEHEIRLHAIHLSCSYRSLLLRT